MDENIYLLRNEIEILSFFTANLTKKYNKRSVALKLKKDPSQTHKVIKKLLKKGFLTKDENNLLSLDYKKNINDLCYIESLKTKSFPDETIRFFVNQAIKHIKEEYLILILFGSAVNKKNPRDYDILAITKKEKTEFVERTLQNTSDLTTKNIDLTVLNTENIYEMASKREEKNVFNELLNKHLILYGYENFYYLLKNARQ